MANPSLSGILRAVLRLLTLTCAEHINVVEQVLDEAIIVCFQEWSIGGRR